MITYQLAGTEEELQQILKLQQENGPSAVPEAEIPGRGFVTVVHSLALLSSMNAAEPAIIAKEGQQLVGYCLAMTKAFRHDIPVLIPMFEIIDTLQVRGKQLKHEKYLVCGQICVAEAHRGQGIFDGLYLHLKQQHAGNYPLLLTEIASRNKRSLKAHKRLGFEQLHTYQAPDGELWEIVYWDWKGA